MTRNFVKRPFISFSSWLFIKGNIILGVAMILLTFAGRARGLFIGTTSTSTSTPTNSWTRSSMPARYSSAARVSGDDDGPIYRHRVCLAVGSNMGDRFQKIHQALQLLCKDHDDEHRPPSTKLIQTSFLRETVPMYLSDQPNFLNGAAMLETNLSPHAMLQRIKMIEQHLGRDLASTLRNGPRPVDLDILLYDTKSNTESGEDYVPMFVNDMDLVIPHASMHEREFVLEPLMDMLGGDFCHPVLNETLDQLLQQIRESFSSSTDGKPPNPSAVRVLALPRNRVIHLNETIIMGILNVTPDSFSDGGRWSSTDKAVSHALQMIHDGATIIDIGGESTRPGAKELDIELELERTIPVIEQLRKVSDVAISIDTRHAQVAWAAVLAGADIVNDVSGGQFDKNMLATVAEMAVPMVLMHMRGTPETMQSLNDYNDIVKDVADAMSERSASAELAGVQRWAQIVDPGIGFAKDLGGNLLLLKNLRVLRSATRNLPILLGTSRKGFIGRLSGAQVAERDPGTIATFVASLCLDETSSKGCNLVRVHNVPECKQAVIVMDAVLQA